MTPLFSTVQFLVPKAAAAALDAIRIRDRAREAGLERTSYEYSTVSTPPTLGRITANRMVVPLLIDEWTAIASRSEGQLVIDCASAAKAGLDAIAPPTIDT